MVDNEIDKVKNKKNEFEEFVKNENTRNIKFENLDKTEENNLSKLNFNENIIDINQGEIKSKFNHNYHYNEQKFNNNNKQISKSLIDLNGNVYLNPDVLKFNSDKEKNQSMNKNRNYSPINPNKSNSNFVRKSPIKYNGDKIFYLESLNNCKGRRHFEEIDQTEDENNEYQIYKDYINSKQYKDKTNVYNDSNSYKHIEENVKNDNYKEYLNYLYEQHSKLSSKSQKIKNLKNELNNIINNGLNSNSDIFNFNSQSLSLPKINSTNNYNNMNECLNYSSNLNNFDNCHKGIDKGIDTHQNNLGLYCLKVSKIRETKENIEYTKNNQLKLKQFIPNRLGFSSNSNNQLFYNGYQKRKEFENKVKAIYFDKNLVK